ncbi:MAG TPA: DMT family transporter, partial [Sphingomonadales bacterium]|nr:DMT family transporter [Sphingomonadales bacterium]
MAAFALNFFGILGVFRKRVEKSRFLFASILAVTLFLWAAAFVAIPIALATVEPMTVIAARLVISSLVFLPFLFREWRAVIKPRLREDGLLITAMAFFGITLYMLALIFGQRTVGAGESSLIVNLTPLMTGALATVFLGETFHPRLIIGGLIAFGGVTLLATSKGGGYSFDPNALLVLLATGSASLFYIIQRKLSAHYSAVTLSALSVVLGTVLVLPFTAGAWEGLAQSSLPSAGAIAFLGLLSGVVPYIGWAYVLARQPTAKAALWLYFVPVIATALGWAVLGEAITMPFLLSGAIIILGVMVGNGILPHARLWPKHPKTV